MSENCTNKLYLTCKDGKWYSLKVVKADEPWRVTCDKCAFFDADKIDCNAPGLAGETCCDCGHGYAAHWEPYEFDVKYLHAGDMRRFLAKFCITKYFRSEMQVACYAKKRNVGRFNTRPRSSFYYSVEEFMKALYDDDCIETVINDLNTKYRTDK